MSEGRTASRLQHSKGLACVAALCSYNIRVFTWDEAKRKENLQKHGIDFADAETIFTGYTVIAEGLAKATGNSDFLHLGCYTAKSYPSRIPQARNDDLIISSNSLRQQHTKDRFYCSQIPD